MKRIALFQTALVGTLFFSAMGLALAQQAADQTKKPDLGKVEYESNCAPCHGPAGKGDGPVARYMTAKVPDLTVLAKANNGVLPLPRIYEVILGDREVRPHGTKDMPIWGHEYRVKAAEYFIDVPYDPEVYVRARILALIEYINRLQEK